MTDPRVAAVEDNLDAFLETIVRSGHFRIGSDADVMTYWSEVAFPLFNGIGGARFSPGAVESRAAELVAAFVDRGLPFLWWATPTGHAEQLEPVLTRLGLTCEPVPGMHRELRSALDPRTPPGVTLDEVSADEIIPVMVEGFGMPDGLVPHFQKFVAGLDPQRVTDLVASMDGEPVACGTVWRTGTTAGVYNVATLEACRGRGLGYAVTAGLLNLAREQGATEAILHASEMGRPLYDRLGFVEVCQTPQFTWMPPAADTRLAPETTVG